MKRDRQTDRQTDRRTNGRMNRQTDTTEVIVAFRNFANAPENQLIKFIGYELYRRKLNDVG